MKVYRRMGPLTVPEAFCGDSSLVLQSHGREPSWDVEYKDVLQPNSEDLLTHLVIRMDYLSEAEDTNMTQQRSSKPKRLPIYRKCIVRVGGFKAKEPNFIWQRQSRLDA